MMSQEYEKELEKKRQIYKQNHAYDNGLPQATITDNTTMGEPVDCGCCESEIKQKLINIRGRNDYMRTYGVAYGPMYIALTDVSNGKVPWLNHIQKRASEDTLCREDLLGEYDIIYIESTVPGYSGLEIHRSASGCFHFSMKTWKNIPALHGNWNVKDNGHFKKYGERLGGTMIEAVTESKLYADLFVGFSLFEEREEEAKAGSTKLFAVDHEGVSRDWWESLPLEEDEYYAETSNKSYQYDSDSELEKYGSASILKVRDRMALPLADTDKLPYGEDTSLSLVKEGRVPNFGSMQEVDDAAQRYHNGSNSWMCNHLPGINSEIALLIRQFITPPPVLYVNPGDLVLEEEDPKGHGCGWTRIFVLRKRA